MAWTSPTTRSTNDLISASNWNTDLVDNLVYLKSAINAEIQISASAWLPSTTSGASPSSLETSTNKVNVAVLDFSDSGSKLYACAGFTLPSDYNGGTVTAKFIWIANSTSTNSVVWGLQGVSFADDDALDTAYGTAGEVTDANKSTAYDVNITAATSAITFAGSPAAGEFISLRIYRDSANGSDTLAATARLLNVIITYTRS